MLFVHDHRVPQLGEVETDLMHASGLDMDARERCFREAFHHTEARQRPNRFAFSAG